MTDPVRISLPVPGHARFPTDSRPPLMAIIEWSRAHESRMGYFAALYTHVEAAIADALARGAFEHPAMLARVNDVFLRRYLDAFDARRRGIATTAVWRAAFDAATSDRLCVIQHLLLGMNAHINFDLAIAATDALDRDELHAFHGDFERMNDLLASLVDEVSADVALFWPLLKWVTRIARRPDDVIIDFSMRCARRHAWGDALKLAALSGSARREAEAHLDVQAGALAREIAQPPGATRLVTRLIRWSERGSVDDIIGDLLRRRPIKIFSGG